MQRWRKKTERVRHIEGGEIRRKGTRVKSREGVSIHGHYTLYASMREYH